jgi:hypothetical protein
MRMTVAVRERPDVVSRSVKAREVSMAVSQDVWVVSVVASLPSS